MHADRITWWEPYRTTIRSGWIAFQRAGFFQLRTCLRPTVIAVIIMSGIVGFAIWCIPGVQIPWVAMVFGVPLTLLGLWCTAALSILIPRQVEVRCDRIVISHGQTVTRIDRERITDVYVVPDGDGSATLCVKFTCRGRERTRSVDVRDTVDLQRLDEILRDLRDL